MGASAGKEVAPKGGCDAKWPQSASNGKRAEKGQRVAIVGGGAAGLAAAYHLVVHSGLEVELFEADASLGGHAHTETLSDGTKVDCGFMVYNSHNYPNMTRLFRELGVAGQATDMSFSASLAQGRNEWSSLNPLCTWSNVFSFRFGLMLSDLLRFNQEAAALLRLPEDHAERAMSMGEWLAHHGYSKAFEELYLVPMNAALWSSSRQSVLAAPALTVVSFFANHQMLQLFGRPQWLTPKLRSEDYVSKVAAILGDRVRLGSPVRSAERTSAGQWLLRGAGPERSFAEEFDHVLFACHTDTAAEILGNGVAPAGVDEALRAVRYADNEVYLHSDPRLMPRRRGAWASWNYLEAGAETGADADAKPVFVSYWLNKLQGLETDQDVFITLNPPDPPAEKLVHKKMRMAHPQYTPAGARAAERLRLELQGVDGLWYAGAWQGYGFHEDAMKSGFAAAAQLSAFAPTDSEQPEQAGRNPCPWVEPGSRTPVLLPRSRPRASKTSRRVTGFIDRVEAHVRNFISVLLIYPTLFCLLVASSLKSLFMEFCREAVSGFLDTSIMYGRLELHLPNGGVLAFGQKTARAEKDQAVAWRRSDTGVVGAAGAPGVIKVDVLDEWFFVRVAMEFDLGLARSYMAGEWEVQDTGPYGDGMTRLLNMFVSNRDSPRGSFSESNLFTSAIGMVVNYVYYKLTMQNTLSGSQANIHAHYDLSNDLFSKFLDKELMMYSSAIYATEPDASLPGGLRLYGSLEDAQVRKVDTLLDRLNLDAACYLLDIGFGWGGISIRAAQRFGCRVHGITLSREQKALAEERMVAAGVQDRITFEMKDYRILAKERPGEWDRIISCEMIEAVGHEFLPDFFHTVEALLARDGVFVMEAITTPESRYENYRKSTDFINTIIFPGSCCPSLHALMNAMAKRSKLYLANVQNIDVHYARTLRDWRVRFCNAIAAGELPVEQFDPEFVRCWNYYLSYCETGFETQTEHCLILTFSRPGNPNATSGRGVQAIGAHAFDKTG